MNRASIPSNKAGSSNGGLTSFKFSEERLFRVVDTEAQKVSVEKGSALKMHPEVSGARCCSSLSSSLFCERNLIIHCKCFSSPSYLNDSFCAADTGEAE